MAETKSRDGLTVVIAGASSGIGRGVTEQLIKEGASVIFAARRTEVIEDMAAELGPNATAVTADVSKEEDVERLYRTAMDKFGKIDVWINNAAIGLIGPYTEVPAEDMRRVVEINVFGMVIGSHFALRQFKEQGYGTLINTGSIASRIPFPYYMPYSATKFAVTGLTEALHEEIALEGYGDIHVCTLHPWATDTPWFIHTGNYTGHRAQLKPMDGPEVVVEVLIGLIDKPQKSVDVETKVSGTVLSHKFLPKSTETLNAKYVQKLIQQAPPAGPTSGALHEPMAEGTGVSGGIREQMKEQDE
ncbi:SDR family NAD(P)-dependent oxidoreductase [Planococcus lenghuensis]|uniref:Oxidoreductase n=1 Tax=Planococcus lenghuensis TaxID=2213202 RepID=A0A1Q2L2D8_9BACL|nr:SDR family NAD(P)-dependent oxidoreductase [Planococcus lenghuensis]AQQ54573.1 oxidoreductase [Planococcus lenghuensis]